MNPLGFTAQQLTWLLVVYVLFFALPAIPVARHARRRGDHWVAWAVFILVTSAVGIVSYWEHVVIQRRRSGEDADAGTGDGGGRRSSGPDERRK